MTRPPRVVSARERLTARAKAERRLRRARRLRRVAWTLAAVAPFVAVGWLLLGSPWLVVHKVVIKGESRLTEAQVLGVVQIRLGTPLARVDTGAVASRVGELGPVATVRVSRSWPDTLEVSVTEREPMVGVVVGRRWRLFDRQGFELGAATSLPAGLVRLEVAHAGPDDPATGAALLVLSGLPKGVRAQVAIIRAASPEQVTLVLSNGKVVIWGGTADGRAKASALVPLLKLPGRTYDVSSPTVVTRR